MRQLSQFYVLARLLTQANVVQARVYRDMLDTLDGDVRRHLMLTAGALAALGRPVPSDRVHEDCRIAVVRFDASLLPNRRHARSCGNRVEQAQRVHVAFFTDPL